MAQRPLPLSREGLKGAVVGRPSSALHALVLTTPGARGTKILHGAPRAGTAVGMMTIAAPALRRSGALLQGQPWRLQGQETHFG